MRNERATSRMRDRSSSRISLNSRESSKSSNDRDQPKHRLSRYAERTESDKPCIGSRTDAAKVRKHRWHKPIRSEAENKAIPYYRNLDREKDRIKEKYGLSLSEKYPNLVGSTAIRPYNSHSRNPVVQSKPHYTKSLRSRNFWQGNHMCCCSLV